LLDLEGDYGFGYDTVKLSALSVFLMAFGLIFPLWTQVLVHGTVSMAYGYLEMLLQGNMRILRYFILESFLEF